MAHRMVLRGTKLLDLRAKALELAGWRCLNPLCRRGSMLEGDHVVPRSQGGPDTLENYAVLCRPCHTLKGQGILLVIPNGDGTFRFHDTRRVLTCECCRKAIDAGALVAAPTPNGGYRWLKA